ncbi:MAG: hypothetical protein ACREJC_04030, partial [Tepidisphaeraceae bacterium]
MNRERLAWSLCFILVAVVALAIPGTPAQREDDYSFVRSLVDIHRQVAANYVESVDEAKMRRGAIEGLLS